MNLYDVNVKAMVSELPGFIQRALALGVTPSTNNFNDLRAATFLIGSKKLEDTFTPANSEGDAFKLLVSHTASAKCKARTRARRYPVGRRQSE
jgi:hypothetical protein